MDKKLLLLWESRALSGKEFRMYTCS